MFTDPESLIFSSILFRILKGVPTHGVWNSLACLWLPSSNRTWPSVPASALELHLAKVRGRLVLSLLLILCSLCFFYLQHPFPQIHTTCSAGSNSNATTSLEVVPDPTSRIPPLVRREHSLFSLSLLEILCHLSTHHPSTAYLETNICVFTAIPYVKCTSM